MEAHILFQNVSSLHTRVTSQRPSWSLGLARSCLEEGKSQDRSGVRQRSLSACGVSSLSAIYIFNFSSLHILEVVLGNSNHPLLLTSETALLSQQQGSLRQARRVPWSSRRPFGAKIKNFYGISRLTKWLWANKKGLDDAFFHIGIVLPDPRLTRFISRKSRWMFNRLLVIPAFFSPQRSIQLNATRSLLRKILIHQAAKLVVVMAFD